MSLSADPWPYAKLFDPSTFDETASHLAGGPATLVKLVELDIRQRHAAHESLMRGDRRARLLAMWLSWSLALLLATAGLIASSMGNHSTAVVFGLSDVAAVCGSVLTSWRRTR